MFGLGTIMSAVMVVLALIACWLWVAPKLTKAIFWTSAVWGLIGLVGQLCQAGVRGPLWVQYRLQDFAYPPWATTLILAILSGILTWTGKELATKKLIAISAILAFLSGFATEIWDTYESLPFVDSFRAAIDLNDYVAITTGAAVTAMMWVVYTKKVLGSMES